MVNACCTKGTDDHKKTEMFGSFNDFILSGDYSEMLYFPYISAIFLYYLFKVL